MARGRGGGKKRLAGAGGGAVGGVLELACRNAACALRDWPLHGCALLIAERFFGAVPAYLHGNLGLLRDMARGFEFFVALLRALDDEQAAEGEEPA